MATNQQQQQPQQPPTLTRKSVTGFVTKLVGDGATYGFINDEIFFQQTSVVSDGPAAVGDRVFAECEYSAHLPIKWNASSVKITNKAVGQQQQSNATAILGSDPRKQSRQNLYNTSQQQQSLPSQSSFHQQHQPAAPGDVGGSVASVQYQQGVQKQGLDSSLQPEGNHEKQANRMLDNHSAASNPAIFYNVGAAAPPPSVPHHHPHHQQQQQPQPFAHHHQQQQQPGAELQPFLAADSPMGPPKLTYTSQLGSAFVQSPLVPAPFLGQAPQPPSLIAQQQQMTQQHHQQSNQMNNNHQRNQQQQHGKQGNRFNNNSNNDSKNDNKQGGGNYNKNVNNNNRNRNEQNRQRDNSQDGRSARRSGSRDRFNNRGGGSSRRDDNNSRASPAISGRGSSVTNSNSGSNSTKAARKHYDAQNVPKARVLTDLNACNMKQRFPAPVHVPSDLKNVIVNSYLRLDIKNTPKPLKFRIDPPTATTSGSADQVDIVTTSISKSESTTTDSSAATDQAARETNEDASKTPVTQVTKSEDSSVELPATTTISTSKTSDFRLHHKYGVKVLLLSLPEMETIYKSVFGAELDSFTSETRSHSRLDDSISLLCNKGPNGGHSLVGGKFDSSSDGFVEGVVNEFERNGKQPDLIATCKRVVAEQTGLDLSSCKSWTHAATFMYNNKSDYFSPKASLEYSYIYMPHIWTMASESFDESIISPEKEPATAEQQPEVPLAAPEAGDKMDDTQVESSSSAIDDGGGSCPENKSPTPVKLVSSENRIDTLAEAAENVPPEQSGGGFTLTLENLADLKVVDLKSELDKREIKYKPNAKKAELVALLRENLTGTLVATATVGEQAAAEVSQDDNQQQVVTPTTEAGQTQTDNEEVDGNQLEEGEVVNDDSNDASSVEQEPENEAKTTTSKRKLLEGDESRQQEDVSATESSASKKVCRTENQAAKEQQQQKVELIREPFVVKTKAGQQQLSLVSLYEAVQVSRHDQFELSVSSNILRESLVQHFGEYILTTLVEENRSRQVVSSATGTATTTASQGSDTLSSSSSVSNSQETQCDTNNNSNNKQQAFKASNSSAQNQSSPDKSNTTSKEFPADRYINLAFTYFDSAHMGYLFADDLNKLLTNCGLSLSKRALTSLIGDCDKFNYRCLPDLLPKFEPTYVYKFPDQFVRLPSGDTAVAEPKMVVFQGVQYNIESLVKQTREAETLRVSLLDRFNYAIENSDKQAEEIHVLEVSRKSLSKAIKAQNDEICELKRERDSLKKKFDSLRKGIKSTISTLSEQISESEK